MVRYQNLTRKPELFRAPLSSGPGTMYPLNPPLAGRANSEHILCGFRWWTIIAVVHPAFQKRRLKGSDAVVANVVIRCSLSGQCEIATSLLSFPVIWFEFKNLLRRVILRSIMLSSTGVV